jgi:hypothetical protein
MFAVRAATAAGALFGGFDGAAPAGATVVLTGAGGGELGRATADADGRFEIGFDGAPGDLVEAAIGAGRLTFTVRDPVAARAAAVRPPLDGVGSTPNDLLIGGPIGAPVMAVVRSGDNAVSVVDLATGLGVGVPLPALPAAQGATPAVADPYFAAEASEAGTLLAVSAAGQRHVYLVDLAAGAIARTFLVDQEVVLDAPFALPYPYDLDHDGVAESVVTRFVPRAPQGVAVIGEALFAGFTDFVLPRVGSMPPIFLPGVLAEWSLAAPDRPPVLHVLPYLDPQWLGVSPDQKLVIVCSGALDFSPTLHSASPGGVLLFDPSSSTITASVALGDFAPTSALLVGRELWAGSAIRGAIERVSLDDPTDREVFSLNDEAVDSVFRVIELPGGLLAAGSFDSDRLHLIDPRRRALDPPPFYGPLATGPGRPIFDGLGVIARRAGRAGVDFVGPDLFALASTASRVTPIELRKVLGP